MGGVRRSTGARFAVAALLLALAGCGGPATFVSTEPPPEATANAWFRSGPAKVHTALSRAMAERGFSLERAASSTVLSGTKQQLPYVDAGSGGPSEGPLPVYRLQAQITADGATHIRLGIRSECPACNGATAYEWEYPVDILRDVLNRTRSRLRESSPRIEYPPRHEPPAWRPAGGR